MNKKCNVKSCNFNLEYCKSKKDFKVEDQHFINIMSLERTKYKPSYFDLIRGIFYRAPLICYQLLLFSFKKKSYYALQNLLTNINKILNIKINIIGDDHINENKKVYVTNHCSFLDAIIFPTCVVSGAVASITQIKNTFGKMMMQCTHVYFVERGKNNNNIEKIQKHIEANGSLTVCPQGMFAHVNTLTHFRTGAFATKFNVQPLIAIYKQDVSSLSMFNILCYPQIDVTVKILPETTKHKDESVSDYAERVRQLMASEGNFLLSDVSSRDIFD